MNIGVICEFNPFHKGHKYLIETLKSGGNRVICVMSGNFVQRGEFAIYDKFERARAALEGGADLVFELPTAVSTSSAEGFAKGGVELLESLGCVDAIAFGAENDNIQELKAVAEKLKNIQGDIAAKMKSGISYPAARSKVLGTDILDCPNNILACEYLKFANLPCIAIKRIGKGLNSDDEEYSATAIRNKMNNADIASMHNCEAAVLYKLRTMSKEDFARLEDVSEGLENRIYDAARQAKSLDELYELIKSKRYTLSRIKRIVLRAYLGIGKDEPKTPYIRLLGFNKEGKELLSEIKEKSTLPIITKISDCDDEQLKFFERECRYTDLYNLGFCPPRPCGTEQMSQIIIK